MFLNMAADIRGLKHCFSQQINLYGQWQVVNSAVKLQQFIHSDTLTHEKQIHIGSRFIISHGTRTKENSLLHRRTGCQHGGNHGALILCKPIIHHQPGC